MPIQIKIDVTKLDKSLFFHGKNGAVYCDLTVWPNPEPDKYGNTHAVQQSLPKERREAGERAKYVGNGKEFGKSGQSKSQAKPAPSATPVNDDDSEIPF